MSLLRGLFEVRHDPAPVTGQVLLDILGKNRKTKSGINVTEKNSLALTAVFRSAALISGTVAGLPLKTYRSMPSLGVDGRIETHVRVVNAPNPAMTDFEFRERQTVHLVLWGNSYALKVRDGSNRVVELWPMLPEYVSPKMSGGEKVFEIRPPKGDPVVVTADEVFHVPGFGYDGVAGLSPIGVAREAVANAMAQENYAGGVYSSGAMVGGLITTPRRLSREQAMGIKQRWKDTIGGVENAHDIGVLDQGMSFEKLSMSPVDIEFIESRKFSVEEIARLYGIPPHMLGDVERSTSWGTGIEEQTIGFVTFTVKPGYLQRLERRYTLEIVPSGQVAEFKIDALLRGSSKVRAEVYERALDPETGWMTKNEVRELENLPPLPEDNEEPVEADPVEAEPVDDEEAEAASWRERTLRHWSPDLEVTPAVKSEVKSREEYVKWLDSLHNRAYKRGRQ